jgi:signal transduction histidine kinase
MFERFWRYDDARTSGSAGAGLGLTIAQGLVDAHGGRIWATPREGGGTRVGFTGPAPECADDLRPTGGDSAARVAAVAPD